MFEISIGVTILAYFEEMIVPSGVFSSESLGAYHRPKSGGSKDAKNS